MKGSEALWYLTRGSGLVSLVALTLVLVLGLTVTSRRRPSGWSGFLVEGLHRNITAVAMGTLLVHVGSAVLDAYAPIGWLDAVLPFASPYRRVWLGLGALAFDLLIVVAVSSIVRARLGRRSWRLLHWLSYACWPLAVVHGLGTGTDTKARWVLALTALCVFAVVAALGLRLAAGAEGVGRRATAGALTVAAMVALVLWTATGPLASNWTRRSGTPVSLVGGHHSAERVSQ